MVNKEIKDMSFILLTKSLQEFQKKNAKGDFIHFHKKIKEGVCLCWGWVCTITQAK